MPKRRWTREDPKSPGIYWVVLIPRDEDLAAEDIRDMARGLRMDPRPPVHVAEVFPDEDQPSGLIPWVAGMDEPYPFKGLLSDFSEVWWFGPVVLPPPLPGRGALRPFGASGLQPFELPGGWPPEEEEKKRVKRRRD